MDGLSLNGDNGYIVRLLTVHLIQAEVNERSEILSKINYHIFQGFECIIFYYTNLPRHQNRTYHSSCGFSGVSLPV